MKANSYGYTRNDLQSLWRGFRLMACQRRENGLKSGVATAIRISRIAARIKSTVLKGATGRLGISGTLAKMLEGMAQKQFPVFCFSNRRCAYCGDPPDHREHVIAISFQTDGRRKRVMKTGGPWCWSCADCNVHLSNSFFQTFRERCEYAQQRLNNLTNPVEWHHWELKNLDYGLREYIERSTAKRKWMRLRSDWYTSREYYLNIEPLLWHYLELNPQVHRHAYLWRLRLVLARASKRRGLSC